MTSPTGALTSCQPSYSGPQLPSCPTGKGWFCKLLNSILRGRATGRLHCWCSAAKMGVGEPLRDPQKLLEWERKPGIQTQYWPLACAHGSSLALPVFWEAQAGGAQYWQLHGQTRLMACTGPHSWKRTSNCKGCPPSKVSLPSDFHPAFSLPAPQFLHLCWLPLFW